MRIVTLNANGVRAAARKGFYEWMSQQQADVVCLQETKAQLPQLVDPVFRPPGWHWFQHDAEKKGYSGVSVYSQLEPVGVQYGLGWPEFDREGRYLQVDFKSFSVISLYLPSGSSGEVRQSFKFVVLERFLKHLRLLINQAAKRNGRQYILCGDWNIAHNEIDIKNWRGNRKNSGFLPEERAWLDKVFGKLGWVDVFRSLTTEPDQYTWWSNRGQAWAKNVGWRIDYQVASPKIGKTAKSTSVYKEDRFSDHAPLIVDYEWDRN